MTREQLQSISNWFRAAPRRLSALRAANALCVGIAVAACAWGVLVKPGPGDWSLTLRLLLTCGVPFVLLSAARRALDRPRPFEVYDLEPLLPGRAGARAFPAATSFPSA